MARAYEQSRVDLSTASRRTIASHILSMAESFGANRDPTTITWMDVQTWVSEAGLKPASLRRYLVTLRGILDYAGVKPNPAADPRVRLPRHVRAVVEPPSASDVDALPTELIAEISMLTPPDDRAPERKVFVGASTAAIRSAMARACKSAGIADYSPHDLRRRCASVQVARGVPVTMIAAQLGHSRNSMTLDTYSHVLIDES